MNHRWQSSRDSYLTAYYPVHYLHERISRPVSFLSGRARQATLQCHQIISHSCNNTSICDKDVTDLALHESHEGINARFSVYQYIYRGCCLTESPSHRSEAIAHGIVFTRVFVSAQDNICIRIGSGGKPTHFASLQWSVASRLLSQSYTVGGRSLSSFMQQSKRSDLNRARL